MRAGDYYGSDVNRCARLRALAERGLGHYHRALSLYRESIAEWREFGNQGGGARCLECIAFILIDRAEDKSGPERGPLRLNASRILGAAERLRETIGVQMTPIEQAEYDGQIAILRAGL